MSALSDSSPARPRYRRRIRYVDGSVQRSLMVGMVTLEVLLVAAAIWLAHQYLAQSIDDNMYRMSLPRTGPTFGMLAGKGYAVLGWFVLINLVALIIGAGIWSRHESRVLREFSVLVTKTRELDFSADVQPARPHEALALASVWRARERERFAAIRKQAALLEAGAAAGVPLQELRVLADKLDALRK